MIDCIIIDDDAETIELLSSYVHEISELNLLLSSSRPLDVLPELRQLSTPAIAFLDIDMPLISGIGLSDMLTENTLTIFVTGHPEYGPTAFDKNAIDYLLKPVSFERFYRAYLKASQWIRLRQNQQADPAQRYLFLSDQKGKKKVYLRDISHVQAMGNYLRIFYQQEVLTQRATLSQFCQRIDSSPFLQVHKSYIINLDRLVRIEFNILHLDNGLQLPLGKTFRNKLLETLGPHSLPG